MDYQLNYWKKDAGRFTVWRVHERNRYQNGFRHHNAFRVKSGDQDVSATALKSALGISTLSGSNTGDEDLTSIKTKLGITTLSGSNTGDQTLPVKAAGTDIDTGTDDAKFLTSKAVNDSHNIPDVSPGTAGNMLISDGTDWVAKLHYTKVATLGSDASTGSNVNPVSLTGLVWTYEASSVYFFKIIGQVSSAAATTGCGFQLDVSGAITEIAMTFLHQLANAGTLSGGSSNADDASIGVSSGVPTLNTNVPVVVEGMLRTGAGQTGTAQVRYRSETTAVTTAKAGMTLVVEKVA